MRQLTGLDAQFLALETPRQTGHVGALAVLDRVAPKGNRSRFVSEAVLHYVETKGQQSLREPFMITPRQSRGGVRVDLAPRDMA